MDMTPQAWYEWYDGRHILDEYAEGQKIQHMKREQERRLRQEHQQTQPKKKRDNWER